MDKDFAVLFLVDSIRYFRKECKVQESKMREPYYNGRYATKLGKLENTIRLLESELLRLCK